MKANILFYYINVNIKLKYGLSQVPYSAVTFLLNNDSSKLYAYMYVVQDFS